MKVEQLIVITQEDGSSHSSPFVSKGGVLRELSMIEENAIYYLAGYVVKKLLQCYKADN